jgi:hypothetical protein
MLIFLLLLYGFKIKIVELLGWQFTNILCIQPLMLDDDAQNNGTHESI